MGACTSKPNVLNGDAPEIASENKAAKDVGIVVREEVLNKDETPIADDGDADKNPSLGNLLNNKDENISTDEKEETSVKASKIASEEKIKLGVEKVVDDGSKNDAINYVNEKKIEEVISETPIDNNLKEVVKPSVESENKMDDQEKLSKEAPIDKIVEKVKPAATEDENVEKKSATVEDPNFESERKKIEEKPAATKKGKFWWDK